MPEKPLTVATYAAGASLAAITLIYVFAPTYFLDGDSSASTGGLLTSRKKGVVGLCNPANDCFINSVLQALAGLGHLRSYLIRELHRRRVDATTTTTTTGGGGTDGANGSVDKADWKLEGLQNGIVTQGLKEMLDALNERPILKKTISATPFVRTLEIAFRQKISRQQQDAQEFLQVVAERLCDEYHAGRRARMLARRKKSSSAVDSTQQTSNGDAPETDDQEDDQGDKDGFPMEGTLESQIECLTCGFKPKPTPSTFCTLTLNVPQVTSTSLNDCFDGMFKTEFIDDFKCEKCRLLHAVSVLQAELRKPNSAKPRAGLQRAIAKLQRAVDTDPETPPPGVELPDVRHAPKRRIARHIRLTGFPNILAIHLSRSIFDPGSFSQKNSAKVAFQERLPLGGLLTQRRYSLLGVVTHKGSHSSGHYESFRRQVVAPPFSNPATFQPSGFYAKALAVSPTSRPDTAPASLDDDAFDPVSVPGPSSPDSSSSTTPGSWRLRGRHVSPTTTTKDGRTVSQPRLPATPRDHRPDTAATETNSILSSARSTLSRIASRPSTRSASAPVANSAKPPKRPRHHDRWWRISDDKVKEASTREVLGMQREVYLLFYELQREDP